jgi:hypothetical protein
MIYRDDTQSITLRQEDRRVIDCIKNDLKAFKIKKAFESFYFTVRKGQVSPNKECTTKELVDFKKIYSIFYGD